MAEKVNGTFVHYLSVLKPYDTVLELFKEILHDIRKLDKVEQIKRTEHLKSQGVAHLQKLVEYFLRYYMNRNENFCILQQTYP